jgi:hypothetical protein
VPGAGKRSAGDLGLTLVRDGELASREGAGAVGGVLGVVDGESALEEGARAAGAVLGVVNGGSDSESSGGASRSARQARSNFS